jgi:argininosuccinate synthase
VQARYPLYDEELGAFEEGGACNRRDAEGFIKLNAEWRRTLAKRNARERGRK